MSDLWVAEEYRRQGVATALFSRAEEIARARNWKCGIFVSAKENVLLDQIYKGLGWEITPLNFWRKLFVDIDEQPEPFLDFV